MENIAQPLEQRPTLSMHPLKFALWLFIISIVMLFAALTSAYMVKQSDGGWFAVQLPGVMAVNTAIIVLSSVFMQWAYHAAKKDRLEMLRFLLLVAGLLGVAFLAGQYYAWVRLVEMNVYFVSNNVSASFIYVFTGLHAVHLISGLVFIILTLTAAFKLRIHSKRLTKIEMCTTYWHFLGGLWVYLYVFLLINP